MLKLVGISKYYSNQETVTQALNKVSLEMNMGEFVVVTGESGSGKSTLLNVISGLDTYEDGELYVNGEETSYFAVEDWENYRKQYIGFVFQNFNIVDSYTVYQNIYVALTIQGYPKGERKVRTLELINRVGLEGQTHQKASKLSGGQKQRVSIARALAKDAPIIVCDEPTGNLDSTTSKNILALLKEISKNKLVVMVTHNFEDVKNYASRRIRLFDGEVVEDVSLQPYTPVEEKVAFKPYKMDHLEIFKLSLQSLRAQPKKSILMLMISLLIVMIFTITYGNAVSEQVSMGDWNPYFRNNFTERLIVTKPDRSSFTEQEIATFAANSRVSSVVQYDVMLDKEFYIEVIERYGNQEWTYYMNNYFLPAFSGLRSEVAEGRLPSAAHEVVVHERHGKQIGDTLNFYTSYPERFGQTLDSTPYITLEVVGIFQSRTNYYDRVIVHEDVFNHPTLIETAVGSMITKTLYTDNGNEFYDVYEVTQEATLPANTGELVLMRGFAQDLKYYMGKHDITDEELENEIIYLHLRHLNQMITDPLVLSIRVVDDFEKVIRLDLSTEYFDLATRIDSAQIALVVEDQFYINQVMNQYRALGYYVVQPSTYQHVNFGAGLAMIATIFLTISAVFYLVVMYFVAYIALRNVMRARTKDFVILRSIGASKRDVHYMTIYESVFTMLYAMVLTYVFYIVNGMFGPWLKDYLRYFGFGHYVFMAILLVGMSLLLALRFNRKIYGKSVISAFRVE